MDEQLIETSYNCPYCGETISTFVDPSEGDYDTIEDCAVCCRPIEIHVHHSSQHVHLTVKTDSD